MAKLHSIGQFSRPQFVFVSFLMIFASLTLTNASPNEIQRIATYVCHTSNPLVKKLLIDTKEALHISQVEAMKFFKNEQNRTYEDAMESIQTSDNKWKTIWDLSKNPGESVMYKISNLNVTEDQSLLLKLYNDASVVRHGLIESKEEADKLSRHSNAVIFRELLKAMDKVRNAIAKLLPCFNENIPNIQSDILPRRPIDDNERSIRNSQIVHDCIIVMEYTYDFARYVSKAYCNVVPE